MLILMNWMGLRPTEEHELTKDNINIVMIFFMATPCINDIKCFIVQLMHSIM